MTDKMRSELTPECAALYAQYELESKVAKSEVREAFTASGLRFEEVQEEARHAACGSGRVGAQLSKTRGGILQEASVKWMGGSWDRLDEKILARMSHWPRWR